MKLPKTVFLGGRKWKIIKNRKHSGGGTFDCSISEIGIGTKSKKHIPEVLIHEIMEASCAERGYCYNRNGVMEDSGHMLFCMDHQQLKNLCADIALALKDNLK